MKKNKKWDYEIKVKYVKELLNGRSYSSIAKEINAKSEGMIANWKKQYLNGTLGNNGKPGRKPNDATDYELLKKCYAQLMKIRSK